MLIYHCAMFLQAMSRTLLEHMCTSISLRGAASLPQLGCSTAACLHGILVPQTLSDMTGCCISLMSTVEGSMQLLHTLHCLLSIQAAPGQPRLWSGVVGQVMDMLWAAVLAWDPTTYSSTDPQTQKLLLDAAELLWAVVTHPSAHKDTRSSDVAGRMLAALQQDSRHGHDGNPVGAGAGAGIHTSGGFQVRAMRAACSGADHIYNRQQALC
jgi:hypothetical protein